MKNIYYFIQRILHNSKTLQSSAIFTLFNRSSEVSFTNILTRLKTKQNTINVFWGWLVFSIPTRMVLKLYTLDVQHTGGTSRKLVNIKCPLLKAVTTFPAKNLGKYDYINVQNNIHDNS